MEEEDEPSQKSNQDKQGQRVEHSAIMTRTLGKTIINYNGPIGGWSTRATGCFDNSTSFKNGKFNITHAGEYLISYSIPYYLSNDMVMSYDGVNNPGFMLFSNDKDLMNFHPLITIHTPNLKCFIQKYTLTLTVTWKLPAGASLSIFYLGNEKNEDIQKEPVVPITIAPEATQPAWWSIVRLS